jgi:hypothetical protein
VEQVSRDHKTLHGYVLLTAIENGNSRTIRKVLHDRKRFGPIEESGVFNQDSTFESIWSLAGYVAALALEIPSGISSQLDADELGVFLDNSILGGYHDWFYRLLKAPAILLRGS